MSTLLKLSEQDTAASEAAEQKFHDVVIGLANGNDPTLDEVNAALKETGRSLDDLRVAVTSRKHRDGLRATIEAAAAAKSERTQLEQHLASAKSALSAAEEAYQRTVRPITFRLREIAELQQRAFHSRSELQRTCVDKKIRRAIDSTKSNLAFLEPKMREARGLVDRLEQTLKAGIVRRGPVSIEQQLNSASAALHALQADQQRILSEQNGLHESLIWA